IEQLTGGNMNLSLFLRNDEEHLSDRVIDLSDWCQGFLYGLGVSGEEDYEQFPNSTQEVIQDIVDICNAAYESNESMEENESAYTEVVEYIRVGVLLIYSELNSENGQSKPVTLH
ncbi:MAG: UPF0149 family protein, partial [Gammaproteobacteria bacterium]|nr:UPF0149 family protein [Gammaproteobacteria bacterium]